MGNSFVESFLSFHHVVPGLELKSSGFTASTFYPLSHFASPDGTMCLLDIIPRYCRRSLWLQRLDCVVLHKDSSAESLGPKEAMFGSNT